MTSLAASMKVVPVRPDVEVATTYWGDPSFPHP